MRDEVITMKNETTRPPLRPKPERPISPALGPIDNDLARDNLENDFDLTAADEQDV